MKASHSRRRSPQGILFPLILLGSCLLTLPSCRNASSPKPEEETAQPSQENRLIVEDAILEQSDAEGNILWKIQTDEAIYSQDRKLATVTGIIGNLYEDGEIILSLKADKGRIINDGERVILQENIVVTDNRYGAVLEASQAEWQPANYLLKIDADLKGKYPNGQFASDRGQYLIDTQELELNDSIEGFTVEPPLHLKGTTIFWQLKEELIKAEAGLEIQQYTEEKITTHVKAEKAEVQLLEKLVTMTGSVLLNSLEPEIQFASDEAVWDIEKALITGKGSVQVTQNKEKVQFQGNQGTFNITTQQANLLGAVRGVGEDPPSTLQAAKVDWNIKTQDVLAQGNVIYEQSDPRLTLKGDRAVGQLTRNTLVVSGTRQKQVITEVIP
ncbi:MAG: LPS export ABC transporter periplasmic protein LptC [Limnothrix sp. RL_2_0]|nr:LPS export ABC transporter periplasmic protein LptC [Limnothrix sp. RL_2_0]